MDPAFEGIADTGSGLKIWRIENFEVVPYPEEKYGQFYQGDSYIVLFDEAGAAAIKSVELDDSLGGVPVQQREVEGHESAEFLSRFKKGIRYLKGGVASGFHHVDPDEPYPKRLFHVKGRRNVRVKQVDVDVSAMNKGDCFILDAGDQIYVYMGPSSKRVERLKAVMVANGIRDDDHAGGAKVIIIDETADSSEVESFFTALGGGAPSDVSESESATEADAEHEKREQNVASLHRVWDDGDGSGQSELVAEKPLQQSMLGSGDCYILDTGGSGIFVWIGRQSSRAEKMQAMELGVKCMEKFGYPKWTKVDRVVEMAEPTVFKQYFSTWKEADDQIGIGRKFTEEQGRESSQDERASSAIHAVNMDNELNGKAVQVRVVHGHEPAHFLRMFKGKMVIFSGGKASGFKNVHDHDTYDVDGTRLFQVRGTSEHDVRAEQKPEVASSLSSDDVFVLEIPENTYIWIGKEASAEEKAMAERMIELLSPGRDGITVNEGEEEDEFWTALGGKDEYQSSGLKDRPLLESRLFHCTDLNEDDVMVLDSGDEVYVWIGNGATEQESLKAMEMAEEYVKTDPTERTLENTVIVRVRQHQEPNAFIAMFPAWNPSMWEEEMTYDDIKKKVAEENAALA